MKKLIYSKYFEEPSKRDAMEYLPSESVETESQFLLWVKELSARWNVDTEIYRKEEGLEVHFFFKTGHYGGLFGLEVLNLLKKCNTWEIPARKARRCRTELILIWNQKGLC